MLRTTVISTLWVLAALECGCAPRPQVTTAQEGVWPFWPTSMRVHPLTRIVKDGQTGQSVIEARLEFFDADGVTTKAVGQLTLQLQPADPGDGLEPLESWNQDLRDLALNSRQYEDVHRMYLFRLQVNPASLQQEVVLRAYFVGSDGKQFNAEAALRR